MAIRCAVLAVLHPDPDRLVGGRLAHRLQPPGRGCAARRQGARRRSPSSSLHHLARLLEGPMPPPADARRGDQLWAWHQLARLPASKLRSRFPRSRLKRICVARKSWPH